MLNAGLSPEHEQLLGGRVDGVGLYRTEIPFMLQSGFPSEEEQVAQYQGMLQLYPNKPVTLRTLDIGGDKALPYMPFPHEANPFLGKRALRLCKLDGKRANAARARVDEQLLSCLYVQHVI